MATHLVIGDPHCTPKASNDRFLWAGRVAADYKVSHVICMGDFCSMDSLSSYDRAKKSFEGRRYQKDMEHSHEALSLFNKGLGKHKPRKIMLHGNHEDRIDRFVDENPELDGTLKISDLKFRQYGWQEIPYKQIKVVDGVYYAQCYLNHSEHFARDTQHMWWSGLVLKREVKDGNYNIETIDIKTIRREYGKK